MNKRAVLEAEPIIWFLRITIVVLIVVFIYSITYAYLAEEIETEELELDLLVSRLLYSESCLAYKDLRVEPGTIDMEKFKAQRLKECFQKETYGFRLNLTAPDTKQIAFANALDERQKTFYPICEQVPEYACDEIEKYVLIQNEGQLSQGILRIEVIRHV